MKKFLFPLPFLVLSVFTSFAKDSPNFIIIYMDDFEGRAEEDHRRKMKKLEDNKPSDYQEQKAIIDQELELKKHKFFANRAITKKQETWPDWYDTARKTVEAEIGMTKGGKLIKKSNLPTYLKKILILYINYQ